MILYTNSNPAHFLFPLHLIYTFFKAPEAMSTLKFEDETATQLSACIKNNFFLCCFSYNVQFNLLPFDPYSEISLLRHKILSTKSWLNTRLPLMSPTSQSGMLDHWQLGMTAHSGASVLVLLGEYRKASEQRRNNATCIFIWKWTSKIRYWMI